MAREGYLVNAGKDTIHDPNAEIKLKTPREKWDNFWFYHKKHVIIGILIAAVAGYMIYDTAHAVQPDYTVGLATQTAYPSQMTDALENEIAKYGKDQNGDGRVVVEVAPYVLYAEKNLPSGSVVDPQALVAYQTKFVADISSGTSMIFLTDDETFQKVQSEDSIFAYLDGTTPKKGSKDYDKMRIPVSKCPRLSGIKIQIPTVSGSIEAKFPQKLSLSLRNYYGSGIEGKEESYYKASRELFQKLAGNS